MFQKFKEYGPKLLRCSIESQPLQSLKTIFKNQTYFKYKTWEMFQKLMEHGLKLFKELNLAKGTAKKSKRHKCGINEAAYSALMGFFLNTIYVSIPWPTKQNVLYLAGHTSFPHGAHESLYCLYRSLMRVPRYGYRY